MKIGAGICLSLFRGAGTNVWHATMLAISVGDAPACVSLSLLEARHLGTPGRRRAGRSLRDYGTIYIRLLRACLSQFLLKEPMPPKNLLYASPSSLALYLTKASSIVQR